MLRVGINGFGRIGRLAFRALAQQPDVFRVSAVNDLSNAGMLANLLARDTTYGRYPGTVRASDDHLEVDGKSVRLTQEQDPARLPWKEENVDVVLEASGHFTKREDLEKHLEAGAPKVILTAPAKGKNPIDFTVILGVNDQDVTPAMQLISNGSCTTNCVVPMAKVLHDAFGIEDGLMTTVHAYTNSQNLMDGISKEPRRARAAAENIVPSSTGAADLIGKLIPELDGKITGMALRVPVTCGSITDLTVTVKKKVTGKDVNRAFQDAAAGSLKGILAYSEEPLVSSDIVGDAHSCTFDSGVTKVVNGTLVKVLGWYDNEWGYSSRLADVTRLIGELGAPAEDRMRKEAPGDRPSA